MIYSIILLQCPDILARRKEEFLRELKELQGPLRDLFIQANVEYEGNYHYIPT